MKKNKLLSEVSSVTLEYMNMHISKTLFTYLKMRKEDRLKGAKKGRSPGTQKTPLNVLTMCRLRKQKKVNIVKIVGLTVQEIEGYKSVSIKQFTSITINFLCCPLLGRSIFFIGILVYYSTKLVTLFFPEHTISIGLLTQYF